MIRNIVGFIISMAGIYLLDSAGFAYTFEMAVFVCGTIVFFKD